MVDFRDLKNLQSGSKESDEKQAVDISRLDPPAGSDDVDLSGESTTDSLVSLYHYAARYMNRLFDAAKQNQPLSLEHGFQVIQEMTQFQPFPDVLFVMAIHEQESPYGFMINHCLNVAIFSLKIAAYLGFDKPSQVQIGTAALMHDIGTAMIPEAILNKKGQLTEKEFEEFRQRPEKSYQILSSVGDQYAYLANIAQQVYERIDGSGYPRGLKGDEIHDHAQIIGLVDMYEAMIHSRPQRKKLLHFTAVKEIIKTGKNAFQRRYLKALLSVFSIFPLFSLVRLNSDAVGKVVETYPSHPLRPKLKIIYDSQNRKVPTERIINLPENPLLYIVDSVSEEGLEDANES